MRREAFLVAVLYLPTFGRSAENAEKCPPSEGGKGTADGEMRREAFLVAVLYLPTFGRSAENAEKCPPSEGGEGTVDGKMQRQVSLVAVLHQPTFGRCAENAGKCPPSEGGEGTVDGKMQRQVSLVAVLHQPTFGRSAENAEKCPPSEGGLERGPECGSGSGLEGASADRQEDGQEAMQEDSGYWGQGNGCYRNAFIVRGKFGLSVEGGGIAGKWICLAAEGSRR